MTARRWLVVALASLTAAGTMGVASPGLPHTAAASCDGRKVRTFSFSTGSVRVYRDGGLLCAVVVPKRAGSARTMTVSVRARGFAAVTDQGRYRRQAGPVRTHAGGRKVWIKAKVGKDTFSTRGWVRL